MLWSHGRQGVGSEPESIEFVTFVFDVGFLLTYTYEVGRSIPGTITVRACAWGF